MGVVIIHLLIVSYAWKAAEYRKEDIFERLGMTREQANDHIFRSLQQGRLYIPPSVISRRISLNSLLFDSKKQLIEDLGAYMKQYVLSEEFNTKYQQYRTKQAPQKQGDVEAGLDHIAEENRKQIKIFEQMAAAAKTPEEKARYEKDIQTWKERNKVYEDKNSAAYAKEKKNAEALKNLFEMANKNKQAELDNHFPADVKAMMRERLQRFLTLTADVDYNAVVKEDSYHKGRKVFANFFYEQKKPEWKLCYRLGKETTSYVRTFAQQWLKELK